MGERRCSEVTLEGAPQSAPDGSPETPSRLGKYEVMARLGQGAMGVVYHAHDPFLDRDVALKVMLPAVAQDPEQKLRFEREARAVARILHPNVVTVFDLGYHTDGSPYIAMELLRGRDLQQILRHGPALSLEAKVSAALQALEGLAQAHAAGIVHRDVKPANVFLAEDGLAKIMDFGVARFTMSSLTSTGVVVGTADYMSPEQVNGVHVDGRSDLWSTGAMLCELLTGGRPFPGENLMSVLFRITNEEPRIELPPGPEYAGLLPILTKALAKDVDHRYQTAREFADALRAFHEGLSLQAAPAPAPPAVMTDPRPTTGGETMDLGPLVLHLDFGAEAPAPSAAALAPVAPPPPFDPTPVFRVLREIHSGGKSGDLHFRHGLHRRSLRFLEGHVLHGTSDVQGEHLGDVLVRYGRLRQVDLDRAVEVVLRDRRRLGGVLQGMGLLDREGLDEAVGLHAREILFDCAGRGGGSFTFEESAPNPPGPDEGACNLATVELILEAARRVQDPAVVRRVLGDTKEVPTVARDAFNRFRNVTLTPADGFLLSRIDGRLALRDLVKLIPLPPESVERSLFALLCTGVVEYARAGAPAASRPVARPTPVPAPAPVPRSVPPPTPFPHPTSQSEARRALEADRARLEEDSEAVEAARRQILEAHEGIATQDHFEFMRLSRAATDAQVKEAYFRLAKPFHPDSRLDPRLAALAPKRDAVFLRLGQAYEALRTASGRKRYLEFLGHVSHTVAQGTPVENPVSEEAHAAWMAKENLAVAEEHHREGRYWDAIQLLESTIPMLEGPDKVRARVALARTQMKNPNWVKRAEESLHALLQESPNSVEACLVLGELYRTTQMRTRALAMYRRALDIDPGNKDAIAALRFLQGPQNPPETGRIRKFFGKAG
jgi:serine/threonine-protein kinase